MWDAIKGLVAEIQTCEKAGATTSAVAMAFVCMDAMTSLSLPADRETQGRADFVAWVDKHLKGHADQPYQYRGIDVYGARCVLLHASGPSQSSTRGTRTRRSSDTTTVASTPTGTHCRSTSVRRRGSRSRLPAS